MILSLSVLGINHKVTKFDSKDIYNFVTSEVRTFNGENTLLTGIIIF